jgi:hypothetical protein
MAGGDGMMQLRQTECAHTISGAFAERTELLNRRSVLRIRQLQTRRISDAVLLNPQRPRPQRQSIRAHPGIADDLEQAGHLSVRDVPAVDATHGVELCPNLEHPNRSNSVPSHVPPSLNVLLL